MLKIFDVSDKKEEKILRTVSRELSLDEIKSQEFKKKITEILDFINTQADGAGLSAPQVGINERYFIVNH